MKLAITGAEIVDPETAAVRGAMLLVEDGRIAGRVTPDEPLRLDCEGEVVRVEPHDGRVSVAVKLTSCQ